MAKTLAREAVCRVVWPSRRSRPVTTQVDARMECVLVVRKSTRANPSPLRALVFHSFYPISPDRE